MLDPLRIAGLLQRQFPYEPTLGQIQLIRKLADFLTKEANRPLFILRGYAGTGKTTIVSALVKILPYLNLKSVLLAPTGRAAKVLASYSGRQAFTIHKKIYRPVTTADGGIHMSLMQNLHTNTLFIVDEASMVPDSNGASEAIFSGRNLLEDLFNYVYSGEKCSLLLLGDVAQLPPVGISNSPALDPKHLKNSYLMNPVGYELTEVVRQASESGILVNATNIREMINSGKSDPPFFDLGGFKDIVKLNGAELEELLQDLYSKGGNEESVVITRSNKRANQFNQGIRNRVLFREEEIEAGDYLMVVRNNYFWLPKESAAGFIANGDVIEVLAIRKRFEMYGMQFAKAFIRMVDYPEEKELEVLLLISTLHTETPSMTWAENQKFFNEIMQDYMDLTNKRNRFEKVKNSEHYNALQVKFAYALTCHKTQGGQWENVIVDQGYLTDDMIDTEYLRWLYTAVTRATKKLYLLNFKEEFYS